MSVQRAVDILMDHGKKYKPKKKAPVIENPTTDPREAKFALNYLDAFGYLDQALPGWKDINLEDILKAIKQFQAIFGLKKDGKLCSRTIKAMEAPRCGMPDIARKHDVQYLAVKEFAANMLPAWRKRALTYYVADYVPGISKPEQDNILFNAFAAWTIYGNGINVTPVSRGAQADIVISTGEGPRSNFDGPGGTLAWAYMPDGNDQQLMMKFDLGDTWVVGANQRGILFFNVACHEFGHLFGLDHSRVQGALMAPYYNQAIAVPQQNDDVPRYTARYGVNPNPQQPTVPTTPTPPVVPTVPPTSPSCTVNVQGSANILYNGRQVA